MRVANRDDVEIVERHAGVRCTVTLEQEASKQVPVQVNRQGSPPQGVTITSVEANPTTVRVTGAPSLVQLVRRARRRTST